MELYDLPNSNLPPFKIEKKDERRNIENNQAVISLISSKLLLNKSLNELLVKFLGITKKTNNFLENAKLQLQYDERFGRRIFSHSQVHSLYAHSRHFQNNHHKRIQEWKIFQKLKNATEEQKKELEKELNKLIVEENKIINSKINNQLKLLSKKIQKELDIFERENKKTLDILDNLIVYICKDCNKIVCSERFHSKKCDCGKDIKLFSDCKNFTIYRLGKEMMTFTENNIWLEHGIDYLLRKKEFQTLCGIHILGHSGILHEIDNVGSLKSENLRIFCECKNTSIDVSDVFIFCGKMGDIGCTKGYIFTTSFGTNKAVKHLARSKNITIIEEVLEKKESKILEEIK